MDVRYNDWRDKLEWEKCEQKAFGFYSSRRQIDIFKIYVDEEFNSIVLPYKRVSVSYRIASSFKQIYKSIERHYLKLRKRSKDYDNDYQVWAWYQSEDGEWINSNYEWDYDSHEKYYESIGYLY